VTFPCQAGASGSGRESMLSFVMRKRQWRAVLNQVGEQVNHSPPPSLLQKTNIPVYINYVLTNNLNKQRGNKSAQNYNY
jgi:hypothetical protein